MKNLSEFKLNRKKKINLISKDLKNFIDKFTQEKIIKNYINKINLYLEVPPKILSDEFKIILFKSFINNKGKFNKIYFKRSIFFLFLKTLATYLYIKLFSKKFLSSNKFDLIIDDIDDNNSPDKFVKLSKKISTIFISSRNLKKIKNVYRFKNYKNCLDNIVFLDKPFVFILLLFNTLYFSLKSNNNLFPFLLNIIKTVAKYETIFTEIKSKFLLQERHYNTSALKNYIFKKKGGYISAATQKNIFQINSLGMYVYCDTLFTLGSHISKNKLKNFNCEVKTLVPTGSLAMELNYYDQKVNNNLSSFDLLVFASDHNKEFHSGYDNYYKEYLIHYDWILKFAKKFNNFKIGIKLKKVITDKNVQNKFNKINNVYFLFDEAKLSDSYFLALKSKSLCTWSSTLGYEFLGTGRKVFFVDPDFKNISFIPNNKTTLQFKINNYKIFEKKILEQIKSPKKRKYKKQKMMDYFCLNSKYSTKIIYNYLKKISKNNEKS